MPKILRFEVFTSRTDQFKEQSLGTTPGLYQGSPATLDFAFFDELAALIDLSLYTDLTLEVWGDQDTGVRLLEKTIAAADFDLTADATTWGNKTKQPVRFALTGSELNFAIAAGKTSETFYMVIGGTPVDGEPETLGYATLKLIKDRFGEPGEIVATDPASYLTAAQSDARYVPFSGAAGFRFSGGYLQLRDTITGNWRGVFNENGIICLTLETPADAPDGNLYRFAGNYLQLKDTVTGGWRSLFLAAGAPALGDEEAV